MGLFNGPFDGSIRSTYFYLRFGMAALAFALPPTLWLGGHLLVDLPLQNSMSAYYHTEMRDVLVGSLVAIGFSLLLYKGFSLWEDVLLNTSGVLAIGIALFPMNPAELFNCRPLCDLDLCMPWSNALDRTAEFLMQTGLHGWFATLFFIPIFFVCAVLSGETLKTIASRALRRRFRIIYGVQGALMLLLPAALVALRRFGAFGHDICSDPTIFAVETALVWVFASFWVAKTIELKISRVEEVYHNRRAPKPDALSGPAGSQPPAPRG